MDLDQRVAHDGRFALGARNTNGTNGTNGNRQKPVVLPPIEAAVWKLCRYIQAHVTAKISTAQLAQLSGYDASHIRKEFARIVGVSAKVFQDRLRQQHFRGQLAQQPIADALYASGYSSPSQIYEKSESVLGMTPKAYQLGGNGLAISYATIDTPLGRVMIAATDKGICFLHFGPDVAALLSALTQEFARANLTPMPASAQAQLDAWADYLRSALAGKAAANAPPLDVQGTAFQILVWQHLQTIPAGQVRSYTDVALAIGKPRAVRAVASACARNKVALLIPCHRVIRGDGGLAGYRWGIERKQALLALEQG